MTNSTISDIRQQHILQRDQLDLDKAQSDSRIVCDKLLLHPKFSKWQHIGIYLGFKNELNLDSFIQHCWQADKTLYAPKVNTDQTMQFLYYAPHAELLKNKFGILEPTSPIAHPIEQFDALIVPGVAFDRIGNRIGMGAGYYDKALAFKVQQPHLKPYLIGVSYDFQIIDSITPSPWDVPVNAILTPTHTIQITH